MLRTAIHVLVDECRAGACPTVVGRLASGWVVLGQRQVLPGYCLLLPDPVVPHLNALQFRRRQRFLADMAGVGDALLTLTAGLRVNYALFGNVEPALHAHIFPRDGTEPEAMRSVQPWALNWDTAPEYSAALHADFQDRLRSELGAKRLLKISAV